jgi:DNA-directed RNA polymerase subunit RPC12/RpoP
MEKKVLRTVLLCSHCNKETVHELHYINDTLDSVECSVCSSHIQKKESEVQTLLLGELAKRITTKPSRMHDEMKNDFWHFASQISLRLVTKPYRFTKELIEMIDEVNQHEDEKE